MDFLISVMSGGLTGVFGSMFGAVVKFFQTKQDREFKKSEWEHELKLHDKNLEASQKDFDNEMALVAQAGSYSGLNESIKADSGVGQSYKWVNAIKSLYRPALTTGLIVLYYLLVYDIEDPEINKDVVALIGYMTSMAVAWWFGDRAFAPPGMKNR